GSGGWGVEGTASDGVRRGRRGTPRDGLRGGCGLARTGSGGGPLGAVGWGDDAGRAAGRAGRGGAGVRAGAGEGVAVRIRLTPVAPGGGPAAAAGPRSGAVRVRASDRVRGRVPAAPARGGGARPLRWCPGRSLHPSPRCRLQRGREGSPAPLRCLFPRECRAPDCSTPAPRVRPPSRVWVWPVTQEASSEAR